MSDERSFTLQCAGAEYRELAGQLRKLARACTFPGPRRSLLQLAGSFDNRAAHFDSQAAGQAGPWSAKHPNGRCGHWSGFWLWWCCCRRSNA